MQWGHVEHCTTVYTSIFNRPISAIRNQRRLLFSSNVPHEWLVCGTELLAERGINC